MHSPVEEPPRTALDDACDAVLDAFIDSFVYMGAGEEPVDRWLQRLIEEMEHARDELISVRDRTNDRTYAHRLRRCVTRVENVLAQLYEEQLHH